MRHPQSWLLSLMLVICLGCGKPAPPMGTVSGKLTIAGAIPKEKVQIFFINNITGQGAMANTEADGSYKLNYPVSPDQYVVYFLKFLEPTEGTITTKQQSLNSVPAKYRNEMTSPLKETVKEGHNDINIDVPAE